MNIPVIKNYAYVVPALILLSALIASCSGGKGGELPPARVLEQSATDVDSLYLLLGKSDAKDIIPHANSLFHRLDNLEVTDSLIQYDTSARVERVQANVNYWMGEYLLGEGRYKEALAAAKNALAMAEQISDTDIAIETHSLMSVIYFRLGMFNDAIENLKVCFDADSESGDKEGMSSDLNNLAAMSIQARQYDNAKDYIDRAIQIERTLDRPDVLAVRLGIASETYALLDRLTEAEAFAREAYRLDIDGGRDCKAAIRLSQLATVLIKMGNDAEALSTLDTAAPILKSCGNMYSYTVTQCQLGDLYYKQGRLGDASSHYRAALDIADSTHTMYLQQRALKGVWESLKDTDIASATPYIERWAQVTDSIFADGGAPADIAEMKSRFERQELEFEKERLVYEMRTQRIVFYGVALIVLSVILVLLYALYTRSKANRTIRNLERIRSNFFTNITHEFRTPLTAIIGLSKDIADNRFSSQQDSNRAVEIINRQSNELLNLVNQLLDISKVRSQVGNSEWRHGDIVSYVSMIIQNYRQMAVDRQIELVFSCAHTAIEMDFVPDYIRKIVRNLVSNALKYTPAGGHIILELLSKDSNLVIRVTDDGAGIEKSELPNIFDPYYSGSGSQPDASTGIGLSLVNEMVRALHGSIKVVSQVGKGTVFIITLPVSHSAAESESASDNNASKTAGLPAADTAAEGRRTDQKVALIVEDNSDLAFYIGSHLPKTFSRYYAQDGKEGLEKAVKLVPDIIITDIMMPGVDGIEMIEKIRKNPIVNHIPVIAITAKVNDTDRVDGIRAGFDAYLTKPFNSEELTIRVTKLLEQRELLQKKYTDAVKMGNIKSTDDIEESMLLSRLVDYIYRQLDDGKSVDIDSCAGHVKYSVRQLSRKLQAITGDTPSKFINRVRIEYAKNILSADPSISLTDLCVRCNFESTDYFGRLFRQFEGMTPKQYANLSKVKGYKKP